MSCASDSTGLACPLTDLPSSQAGPRPWVNLTQANARARCQALGAGHYDLISTTKWMTIAVGIENNPLNWIGGVVGTNNLYRGHSDGTPANSLAADSDDRNDYYGTGNAAGTDQKRTLRLSNDEIIWDFSGNVYESTLWNKPSTPTTFTGDATLRNCLATPADLAWHDLNTLTENATCMPQVTYMPNHATYTSAQGIGQYFGNATGSGGTAIRGGSWAATTNAGIFSLSFNATSSNSASHADIGFRCIWIP